MIRLAQCREDSVASRAAFTPLLNANAERRTLNAEPQKSGLRGIRLPPHCKKTKVRGRVT